MFTTTKGWPTQMNATKQATLTPAQAEALNALSAANERLIRNVATVGVDCATLNAWSEALTACNRLGLEIVDQP